MTTKETAILLKILGVDIKNRLVTDVVIHLNETKHKLVPIDG